MRDFGIAWTHKSMLPISMLFGPMEKQNGVYGKKQPMNKNFWQNRNVFITGSTGLLGSWLTEYVALQGANVSILIRDHIPKSHLFLQSSFPQVNVIKGAVEDYLLMERILGEYEIDTVFHLAAQTIAPIANR